MKTKLVKGTGLLVSLFLLATSALAMSSTNYYLAWFTPLTTGGGGPSSSTNYIVNVTLGQSVIGQPDSTNYQIGLGYWYGGMGSYFLHLPLILR